MTEFLQNWHHFDNAEAVAHASVYRILLKAQEAISHRGSFKLVLAGGTTPERVYELLASSEQEWSKWHLFIGDERCLPSHDVNRNSVMIKQKLLSKVNFPMENFYPIEAQLGSEQAAIDYSTLIKPFLPFDLILLGMGEDGHTASLFPGHIHDETELVHAIHNAPKAPSERVSLSKKAIMESHDVIILVTGISKKTAVQQWLQQGLQQELQQNPEEQLLPIAQIQAAHNLNVLIDNDAQPSKSNSETYNTE